MYGITTQLGGVVRINTQLGKGTTIAVYLPRAEHAAVALAADTGSVAVSARLNGTILVVDDDRDVREFTVACLESFGYAVLAVDSGTAALDIITSAARIDMMLIDIAMPEIGGTEVAREALAAHPHASPALGHRPTCVFHTR